MTNSPIPGALSGPRALPETPSQTPKPLRTSQAKKKKCVCAAFLLTVGSFLLTVELFLLTIDNFSFFAYSWSSFAYKVLASLLTIGACLLAVEESASNNGLKGL